jgi:L-ascorbate metabolism protein UlaG (beta-lactamase superfamily)
MNAVNLELTYIGGPTLVLELGGIRLLTDPTFDPAGGVFRAPLYELRKTLGPAVSAADLGKIDVVLLSHDHHYDNLDTAGRELLANAGTVLTTQAGAGRLGGNARGIGNWESIELPTSQSGRLTITGTPARHGPPDGDRGPVTGFVLVWSPAPERAIYVSGDTVWCEGVAAVSRRFPVHLAILFLGAARLPAVGPSHLTMTAEDALHAADAFPKATIVPVHYEGWAHFSQSRADIARAFAGAGLEHRLRWLDPGRRTPLLLA